jgi:hypothetical protein
MQQLLVGNPALGSLFENVLAARPTSESLDRHAIGRFSDELPRIVDRPNVQQAPRTDGPVISGALATKTDRAPVAAIAVSARGADGQVLGLLAGVGRELQRMRRR